MKLMFHVLRENKTKKIDNEKASVSDIKNVLTGEFTELHIALTQYERETSFRNMREVIRETYDVIQICILILWRCHLVAKKNGKGDMIQDINIEHKDKLMERGWTIETGIEVEVKE